MSDEVTSQDNPGESIEQVEDSVDSASPVETSEDNSENEEAKLSSEDKIIFTKEEFNRKEAKTAAKAERRARRKLEAEYAQKLAQTQQNSAQGLAQQQAQQSIAPSADHIWDNVLGWIHKDTTREQYSSLINSALQAIEQHGVPGTTATQSGYEGGSVNQSPNVSNSSQYSDRLLDQIDDCAVEFEDLGPVLKSVNISKEMLEAAALSKGGIEDLYKMAKEDPNALLNISRLDPYEQQSRVLELQQKRKTSAKKIPSATPQPEPLRSNGNVKNVDEMSFLEKQRRKLAQQFDR